MPEDLGIRFRSLTLQCYVASGPCRCPAGATPPALMRWCSVLSCLALSNPRYLSHKSPPPLPPHLCPSLSSRSLTLALPVCLRANVRPSSQIRELRAAIRQRDSLLRIVSALLGARTALCVGAHAFASHVATAVTILVPPCSASAAHSSCPGNSSLCMHCMTRAPELIVLCERRSQINGEDDQGESEIVDNPQAPLVDRLRALQKQLKDRDDALEEAGSVADELVATGSGRRSTSLSPAIPHAQRPGWGVAPAGARSGSPSGRGSSSGGVMPQKVARPSWLSPADPTAGGSRLKESLQAAETRYAQQYTKEHAQRLKQQQQQHRDPLLASGLPKEPYITR